MKSQEKICPLLSVGRFAPAPCAGENCAWWDHMIGTCFISLGADCTRETQNQLNVLNMIMEKRQEQDED